MKLLLTGGCGFIGSAVVRFLLRQTDHVVINVLFDMDRAAALMSQLGFSLTPRGYHSLGSINHLAMFDDDYLELVGLPSGTDVLRKDPPLEDDQAQVGVPLTSGKYPPDLRSGDAVRLTRIGDASNPSAPLATGLVLKITTSKAGSFGSDSKSSVAEILIPKSVADLVVGATGTDDLGIVIVDRGVALGDEDIEALVPGRS